MRMNRGMSTGVVMGVIVLLVVGAGWYYANRLGDAEEGQRNDILNDRGQVGSSATDGGELLAGDPSLSPLYTFDQALYQEALDEGKAVFLWYYSNWCPTCQLEQKVITQAFDEFGKEGVVGFRVNIGDSDTDSFEEETAREFGVAYRHTKVAIKDGERVLKTPETWNKNTYLVELTKLIQ